MTLADDHRVRRVPLSSAQRNIYNGVLQDPDPALYLIGKAYRFPGLNLPAFLSALEQAVLDHPVHLCVLAPTDGRDYPDLVAELQFDDIVCVRGDHERPDLDAGDLVESWAAGIHDKSLARYTIRIDNAGLVVGMHAHTHHILFDGGATGIIEADLARYLAVGNTARKPGLVRSMDIVAEAHRHEGELVERARQRYSAVVRRELSEEALSVGDVVGVTASTPGTAARGVLRDSVRLQAEAHDAIVALAAARQIPINVLVAAAAVAVHASERLSTQTLLVHPVDNRFGDPTLDVATCLVNSVAQMIRFAPFASVGDVVHALDRGYVKAVRRRWFREELYRRIYLTINRHTHIEALTVNYMRGLCAPELRPHLCEAPVVSDIGPVEGTTVTCVHDEESRTFDISIWRRADSADRGEERPMAQRIAATLEGMNAGWERPFASAVGEWSAVADNGDLVSSDTSGSAESAPAWFADPTVDVARLRTAEVDRWIARILLEGAVPGDVVVFTDDGTSRTTDLLIACHLAGCGYSVCAAVDDLGVRASSIHEHGRVATRVIDVSADVPPLDDASSTLVDGHLEQVVRDPRLADWTAYVMPTSGSTGQPKLVPVSHGALALFCTAIRRHYVWGPDDTVLQCATLTSDISVEEIFGAAYCGAGLVRTPALHSGDLPALVRSVVDERATIVDLPTAIWHLLCEDTDTMQTLGQSALRQVIIGGEAVRPAAVDKWSRSIDPERIELVSTYGPTETTVVATYLAITDGEGVIATAQRSRLGRPLVPGTVFIAFGEVVIVGGLVSRGYLGRDSTSFGAVCSEHAVRQRAFATADRVVIDDEGFPVFAGRRDAIVKIAGRRVDTAAIATSITSDPLVSDLAVEPVDGVLEIWFQSPLTRDGDDDPILEARIRNVLVRSGVASFRVTGVPGIPRKPNGKIDAGALPTRLPHSVTAVGDDRAAGLAELWSGYLGRAIAADSSLLDQGIGSLDLIKILPETRKYLNWQLSVLDLIGADTAANLVGASPDSDTWMDSATASLIADDVEDLVRPPAPALRRLSIGSADSSVVVLGAAGILGTGFAKGILQLGHSHACRPEVVFVSRSPLPEIEPWSSLRTVDGFRFITATDGFGVDALGEILRAARARTLVNCVGNTNVLLPYQELRPANVEVVSAATQACARNGSRLAHLSTFVVNAEVDAPRVTDPRHAPYPYAASKSVAELVVANASDDLDFTIVRLPRVLRDTESMRGSADILASVVDACKALGIFPDVELVEEVTTNTAAALSIIDALPEFSAAVELGGGITVVRGEPVSYTELLGGVVDEVVGIEEWKQRLDQSAWARAHPGRWAVIDAWISLGSKLGGRSYTEYLSERPTIDLPVESCREVAAAPMSLREMLTR
ncbi:AMP-binding protein [Mycolicibacterium sp. Y3]